MSNTLKIKLRKWELFSSQDMNTALNQARILGWLEDKVQVRKYGDSNGLHYVVEPYEKDCSCPGIIPRPLV